MFRSTAQGLHLSALTLPGQQTQPALTQLSEQLCVCMLERNDKRCTCLCRVCVCVSHTKCIPNCGAWCVVNAFGQKQVETATLELDAPREHTVGLSYPCLCTSQYAHSHNLDSVVCTGLSSPAMTVAIGTLTLFSHWMACLLCPCPW